MAKGPRITSQGKAAMKRHRSEEEGGKTQEGGGGDVKALTSRLVLLSVVDRLRVCSKELEGVQGTEEAVGLLSTCCGLLLDLKAGVETTEADEAERRQRETFELHLMQMMQRARTAQTGKEREQVVSLHTMAQEEYGQLFGQPPPRHAQMDKVLPPAPELSPAPTTPPGVGGEGDDDKTRRGDLHSLSEVLMEVRRKMLAHRSSQDDKTRRESGVAQGGSGEGEGGGS